MPEPRKPSKSIRLLTLTEAVLVMLPLSLIWLLGVGWVVQLIYQALRDGTQPVAFYFLAAVWLAFCGMGLCALWELFLRHHVYTLRSLPMRVKVGLVLGFVALAPLCVAEGLKGLVVFVPPLALLAQFYYLLKRNDPEKH